MSLMRFTARVLLASYFITDGVKAALTPEARVADAEPLASRWVAFAQRHLPPSWASHIPTNTETLVRLHGATQAVGGAMLATGVFRRTGAAVVAAAYLPKVIMARTSARDNKQGFVRELALLGAALIAAGDTGGKPTLAWMAAERRRQVALARKAARVSQRAGRQHGTSPAAPTT
jgi:uncharacterized membrane protein YphA (DoxX/SURF4 family)